MTFVPLDVLTAEEMNQIVANIEALANGASTFIVGRNGGSHSYTFKINRSTGSGITLFVAGRIGIGGLYVANAWAEVIALNAIPNMTVSATGGVDAGSDTVTVTFTNNNASASFPFAAITIL
jgi:hypothetical protein